MRKYLSIFVCVVFSLIAVNTWAGDLRNTFWGMSVEQCKTVDKELKFIKTDSNPTISGITLEYAGEFIGWPAVCKFSFLDDRLYYINMEFTGLPINAINEAFENYLKMYGEPLPRNGIRTRTIQPTGIHFCIDAEWDSGTSHISFWAMRATKDFGSAPSQLSISQTSQEYQQEKLRKAAIENKRKQQ